MTVDELITLLKRYPGTIKVVLQTGTGGYEDVFGVDNVDELTDRLTDETFAAVVIV